MTEARRFDVCPGDRAACCMSCSRSAANAHPALGDAVAAFHPAEREGRCPDWRHAPRTTTKPEDRL